MGFASALGSLASMGWRFSSKSCLLLFFAAIACSGFGGSEGVTGLLGDAIASSNAGPKLERMGLLTPQTLYFAIQEGYVGKRHSVEYEPDPEDRFEPAGSIVPERLLEAAHMGPLLDRLPRQDGGVGQFLFVYRKGLALGWVVGPERSLLWPVQPLEKTPLDVADLEDPSSYRLIEVDSLETWVPVSVSRKSRAHGKSASGPSYNGEFGVRHEIALEFPAALQSGSQYRLELRVLGVPEEAAFRFDDTRSVSEALHVNLAGYEVSSQSKIGYYSAWLGRGSYADLGSSTRFLVCDAESGEAVFEGEATLRTSDDGLEWRSEAGREVRHAGGPVWEMDFSDLDLVGRFRLRLPGIGVSPAFGIGQRVWEEVFAKQMLGFLNQRSGIALGPPFTAYRRPMNLNPKMGAKILSCDQDAFWSHRLPSGENEANPFSRIEASVIPGTQNPHAWGSWADAADHDRRYRHLEAVHVMLGLWERNSDYFGKLKLSLPEDEVSNGLPDILDEAWWGLGLYLRTQREDGAIVYGVESLRHPNRGEPSWLETLPVAVVPPTPDAAYTFAGAAARMAVDFKVLGDSRAEALLAAAGKAFSWALIADEDERYPERYRSQLHNRVMAAFHLWKATREDNYEAFLISQRLEADDWIQSDGKSRVPLFENLSPAVEIALSEEYPAALSAFRRKMRVSLPALADRLIEGASESAFRLLRQPGKDYFFWIVESEGSEVLIAAHILTGESRYIDVLEAASHFALGANPLNLSYTSGIGDRSITPMIGDAEFSHAGSPVGIPAYGPCVIPDGVLPRRAWAWDERRSAMLKGTIYPKSIEEWPLYEAYFESISLPAINEFTLHQGMCDQLRRWGYLAQIYD
ncbi:glycoside hydrolase family 9 protein [Pelagicoccus enzymogenes]|nr:glycoside hydrolase family 9 protein [Pelagicoccus enzymogenes]